MIWALCGQKGRFVHDFRPRLLTLLKVRSTSEPSPGKTNMKCFNRIAKFTLKTIKYRYSCRSWLLITTEKEVDTLILVPASGQTGGITLRHPWSNPEHPYPREGETDIMQNSMGLQLAGCHKWGDQAGLWATLTPQRTPATWSYSSRDYFLPQPKTSGAWTAYKVRQCELTTVTALVYTDLSQLNKWDIIPGLISRRSHLTAVTLQIAL